MKAKIHPQNYREVVFKDMSNDDTFITRSTVATAGRVDKFRSRYGNRTKK